MRTGSPRLSGVLRTSVELDRELVRSAMKAVDASSMREAIELGLKELIDKQKRLAALERHYGKHPDFELPEDDLRE